MRRIIVAVLLLVTLAGCASSTPCDQNCQMQQQTNRLKCLYNNGTDC